MAHYAHADGAELLSPWPRCGRPGQLWERGSRSGRREVHRSAVSTMAHWRCCDISPDIVDLRAQLRREPAELAVARRRGSRTCSPTERRHRGRGWRRRYATNNLGARSSMQIVASYIDDPELSGRGACQAYRPDFRTGDHRRALRDAILTGRGSVRVQAKAAHGADEGHRTVDGDPYQVNKELLPKDRRVAKERKLTAPATVR